MFVSRDIFYEQKYKYSQSQSQCYAVLLYTERVTHNHNLVTITTTHDDIHLFSTATASSPHCSAKRLQQRKRPNLKQD